ncbi:OLC1v1022204C1 [Oldenlandia corymbosa var. corymbosa]|uniref:OLC1v1022204C1 n=1 Tax=Oldenlandia corymbosa var. corymbosa TaxID=529605 RepID=A0AAV1BXC4_OLDCO|nr:OLC1v1022204C1 [Oldenlandia corymbosa var. corymbosa]
MVGVAVKGKLNYPLSNLKNPKPKGGRTVAIPSLKIFAEPNRNSNAPRSSLANPEPEEESSNPRKSSLIEGKYKGNTASSSKKKKGKLEKSGTLNVRRKVLADISNVKASSSTAKAKDTSKSLYDARNSLVGARASGISSRKPLSSTVRTALTQVTINHHTAKKVGCKDTKTNSEDSRTKTQSGQLLDSTSTRVYGRHQPTLIRKSFPAIKQVKKEYTERSHGCKEGLPVSSKVGRTVTSRVTSSYGSHFGKTRVSDGFIVRGSKGRTTLDTGASRRSVKLVQTMRRTNSKTEGTSNSRPIAGFSKLPARYDISFKKNEEKGKLSSTKNINQEEVSSFDKSLLPTAENVPKRKSGRRKSFITSLLTSESKDDFPNIYDSHNHLEVSEYIDDIYQYYWVMESQNQPLKQYLAVQTEITPQMRGILINWLIEVHLKFDLMQETLFLMVTLLDQFLSLVSIKKNKMQLVGLTALLLASKYEDFWHPRIVDLIGVSADSYTREEMLRMENAFLTTLKFRLNAPTPYVFMLRFIKAAQSDKKFEHLAFYLIELCLVEYEALKYKPSLLCASAIYLARCTLQMNPKWTLLLQKHTRYEEDQIRQCAEMILKFHKAAKTALLRVTHEKYMKPEFSRAADISPLEVLPQ